MKTETRGLLSRQKGKGEQSRIQVRNAPEQQEKPLGSILARGGEEKVRKTAGR